MQDVFEQQLMSMQSTFQHVAVLDDEVEDESNSESNTTHEMMEAQIRTLQQQLQDARSRQEEPA
jgi:hypothetical protein